jgi:hypothetical protein
MELSGVKFVPADIKTVWLGLNNTEVLKNSIPGCEKIERLSPEEIEATVMFKIGPVKARFSGKLILSDVVLNRSCTMNFAGSGGAAGFAKGQSKVELHTVEGGTNIIYSSEASIGGKLGQIGGRLISASAKKIADDFFEEFSKQSTAYCK